tara:strand:- start:297 stop:1031 length:735 start_codon:yes stop_codon:yes gene_type:complete
MNKDWFVNWFNTSYYHTLYQHRDEAEACRFIDNLCAYLKIEQGAKILDLACGKGRHSIHLAKKGFLATGIDLAKESIIKAKASSISNVEFDVHDMRLPYKENEFDFVFNLFTSFGYFKNQQENIDVLKGVATNLKEEGFFVLDFLNATKVIKNLVSSENKTLDGIEFELSRSFDGANIIKDILVKDENQSFQFQERVSAFKLEDMEDMAIKAGLQIIATFGDYDLNPFLVNSSDRLILIMKTTH